MWLARAALFVGLCLSDLAASEKGQSALLASQAAGAALRLSIDFGHETAKLAFVELALMHEQAGDLQGARAVAKLPGSPWTNPLQRPGFMAPGLEAQAFWSQICPQVSSWISALENNWQTILGELGHLMNNAQKWCIISFFCFFL
jgi:hypothetical protein